MKHNNQLKNPTNVRMDQMTKDRLRKAAHKFGLSEADLIRQATRHMLEEWEAAGALVIKGVK